MKKVINPCQCETYKGMKNAFAKIEYKDGTLSISGVIGPRMHDAYGSAGQCCEEIRKGQPTEEWTEEMLAKFCDIWDRWHLNDMNPCCEHQRKLGWLDEAKETLTLYHYKLKRESADEQKKAEKEALKHLKAGETFTPTKEQTFYAMLPYFIDRYSPMDGELAEYYELFKGSLRGETEKKTRGLVRFDEDKNGILCKPCPVCGYKYGTEWKREDIPKDVIYWLFNLPETKIQPSWV